MKWDEVMHYRVTEHLRNGLEVTIRAIKPDDKELIVAAFRELDEATVYMRFFELKKEITDRELKWATEIDYVHNIALVGCIRENEGERIIGIGRYVAADELTPPSSAEVAFIVEKGYQGLGLASALLRHLMLIGQMQGISRFEAEVLPSNKAMLRVFGRAGLPMIRTESGDSVHITIFLNKGESK